MKSIYEYKLYVPWIVFFSAILLPFIVISTFPSFYHTSDVDDFWRWSQSWDTDWRSIYVNCDRCNYPFIGTLLSGGMISMMDGGDFGQIVAPYRYYLAVVDALNVLAIWLILKMLYVKNHPLWAGVIGLLPSSWLGSSVWGQIDGVGQFLILLFFLLLIWFNRENREIRAFYRFAFLVGLLLSLMLLTKQLIYFSVFALALIFLANMLIFSRKSTFLIISSTIVFLSFVLPIVIIDMNLNLKDPYFSHLQYILATGSSHGDIISSMGFNIWVFFSDNLPDSSRVLLPIKLGSTTLFSIEPYASGIFLFLLINTFLIFIFANHIRIDFSRNKSALNNQFVLMSFVYFALVNLSFNLLLTGTHERYLYYFYPFIIVACLVYSGRPSFFTSSTLIIVLSGSVIYGVFLFGYLNRWIRPSSLSTFRWMSAFHLMLFCYLVYITIRQFNSQKIDMPSQL